MAAIVSVQNVRKTYADGFEALKDVNLEIKKGEIIALLGPNGAGKTTLISIICGITSLTSGKINVDGMDISSDYRKVRAMIGLVPQEIALEPFETVINSVKFSRGLFGKKKNTAYLDEILKTLSLFDKKNAKVMTLSGGMKRRVLIAKALAHEPRVLFLDEPTAGVDVELRQKLWAFIKELNVEGHTIVLTTHYLEEAEALCNRVAMLRAGKVVALDTTTNLLKKFAAKNLRLRLSSKNVFKLSSIIKGINFSVDGDFYTFELKKIADISKIIAALNKASIEMLDMETVDQDLENIFLKLTGDKI